MRSAKLLFPFAILFVVAASAQCPEGGLMNLPNLPYLLVDAPIPSQERDKIYQLIDAGVHSSFTDKNRQEESTTVMGSPVGYVQLSQSGEPQLIVRGPLLTCGASGNCQWWVFVWDHGQLREVLETVGTLFRVDNYSHGFIDLASEGHPGGPKNGCGVYHWDGTKYVATCSGPRKH